MEIDQILQEEVTGKDDTPSRRGSSKRICGIGMPQPRQRQQPSNWTGGSSRSRPVRAIRSKAQWRRSGAGNKRFWPFFTYWISNEFVEGKNNRTKMMMRRSDGFKNRQHLGWHILAGNLR